MARVYGTAGGHSAQQSVAAFKKIFLILLSVTAALCFGEGVVATVLVSRTTSVPWLLVAGLLVAAICWVSRDVMKRVEAFEKQRFNYRAGFLGEYQVAVELEGLSDQFTVFNNVNTKRGNLDHVVVGPTGLFAIETKNWSGLISATSDGELMRNGKAATTDHVQKFLARSMMVREQAIALVHAEDFRIRAVMAFPKAHVDTPFNKTKTVHCVRLTGLRNYIENPMYSAKLSDKRIGELVRALLGIAGMDIDFPTTSTAAVNRSKNQPAVVATVAPIPRA